MTGNVFFTVAAIAGSVFPDAIEGNPQKMDSRIWRKRHRKKSHCLAAYIVTVLLVMVLILLGPLHDELLYSKVLTLVYWFLLGAVLHILQDALCGQVPVWGKHWIGHKWFSVGSVKEYLFTLVCSAICLSIRIL